MAAIQDRYAEFLHTPRISVWRLAWFIAAPSTAAKQTAKSRRACSNLPRSAYRFAISPARNAIVDLCLGSLALVAGRVELRRTNRRSRTFANHQARAIAPLFHREIAKAVRPCRRDSIDVCVHNLPPLLPSRRAVAFLSPPNRD